MGLLLILGIVRMLMKKFVWFIYLSVLMLLCLSYAYAADGTPYNIGMTRPNPACTPDSSITWVVTNFDFFSHYGSLGAVYHDSLQDSADIIKPDSFLSGPYGSDQEINAIIYDSPLYNTVYSARILDTSSVWLWLLVEHYLDSVGYPFDSVAIAWLDTDYFTKNDGRGDGRSRHVRQADTLDYIKTFVAYQTFDNDADDTKMFPSGYAVFANGGNVIIREAIAYAFGRAFFDDEFRAAMEGGYYHRMNYLYMDNQYGDAGFLGSYWSMCDSIVWYSGSEQCWPDTSECPISAWYALEEREWPDTSHCPTVAGVQDCDSVVHDCDSVIGYTPGTGGPTAGVDFTGGYEDVNIEGGPQNDVYMAESTHKIDSAVMAYLDSVAEANGYDSVETCGNADWDDPDDVALLANYVSMIFLEGPWEPGRSSGHWERQDAIADTMATGFPDVYIAYYVPAHGIVSSLNYDSTRAILAHYALFMCIQNKPQFYFVTDRTCFCWPELMWQKMFTIDFGNPVGDTATDFYTGGSGLYGEDPLHWVKGRKYVNDDGDTSCILFHTSRAGFDVDEDTAEVNLHNLYYEIDSEIDTSLVGDSIFKVIPYEGRYLTQKEPTLPNHPSINNLTADSAKVGDASFQIIFSIADDNELCSLEVRWETEIIDSNVYDPCILISSVPAGDTVITNELAIGDTGACSYEVQVWNDSAYSDTESFDVTGYIDSALVPELVSHLGNFVDTVMHPDTIFYSIDSVGDGSLDFDSVVAYLSTNSGVTYSTRIAGSAVNPTGAGDTILIWTPQRSDTGSTNRIKLVLWSDQPEFGTVFNDVYSTSDFTYFYQDTTLGFIGSSDTASSGYTQTGQGQQVYTPFRMPSIMEGTIKLDSGWIWGYDASGGDDTAFLAIREATSTGGGTPGDLIAMSDSNFFTAGSTEIIKVDFNQQTINHDTVYYIGTVVYPETNVHIKFGDTTGVTIHYILSGARPLPTTYPGSDGTSGTYDEAVRIWYHVEDEAPAEVRPYLKGRRNRIIRGYIDEKGETHAVDYIYAMPVDDRHNGYSDWLSFFNWG